MSDPTYRRSTTPPFVRRSTSFTNTSGSATVEKSGERPLSVYDNLTTSTISPTPLNTDHNPNITFTHDDIDRTTVDHHNHHQNHHRSPFKTIMRQPIVTDIDDADIPITEPLSTISQQVRSPITSATAQGPHNYYASKSSSTSNSCHQAQTQTPQCNSNNQHTTTIIHIDCFKPHQRRRRRRRLRQRQ